MNIRNLRADEIECRVQKVTSNKSCLLLLYKDARCDMKILDETFGILGWTRRHEVINNNLFCTVSLWNDGIGMWVEKQDVGVESYTEKEKGEASDSFKRACFNIGIGRELYTAPVIWINLKDNEIKNIDGKDKVTISFYVSEIETSADKVIEKLIIKDSNGQTRFTYGASANETKGEYLGGARPVAADPKKVICPKCGEEVMRIKGKDASPAEILEKLGSCYPCYKKCAEK